MIAVANRIFVNPEYAEAFEQRFRDRAGLVDAMPGFISNQVLRPTKADEPYIVLTYWQSQADFEAWIKSDSFTRGHASSSTLPREAFTGPSKVEVHEVISDSRPTDEGSQQRTTSAG